MILTLIMLLHYSHDCMELHAELLHWTPCTVWLLLLFLHHPKTWPHCLWLTMNYNCLCFHLQNRTYISQAAKQVLDCLWSNRIPIVNLKLLSSVPKCSVPKSLLSSIHICRKSFASNCTLSTTGSPSSFQYQTSSARMTIWPIDCILALCH